MSLVQAISTMTRLCPTPPPPYDVPVIAAVEALEPLGTQMSAQAVDVAALRGRVDRLGRDRDVIAQAVEAAREIVFRCIADLVAIAQATIRSTLELAPSLVQPGGPAVLQAMAASGEQQALQRVDECERELEPHVQALGEVEEDGEGSFDKPVSKEPASDAGQAAVEAALSQVGSSYVWGGNGAADGGFDCSGLVKWAYGQAGVDLPRTAAEQAMGTQVTADQLQPGDLAVWSGHVSMYIGDGMMVEAGDPVQTNPVRTTNIGMPFKGFWRPTG